jgi:hypothetical protein
MHFEKQNAHTCECFFSKIALQCRFFCSVSVHAHTLKIWAEVFKDILMRHNQWCMYAELADHILPHITMTQNKSLNLHWFS